MRNTRTDKQTRLKNCMKWTASVLLLAVVFVLVFAGTLSGAFGIESELQQNGIIKANVAQANWDHKAGITIGDSNSGGRNATAMSPISDSGKYEYYSSTSGDTALTSKFGIYMSNGSTSDCKGDYNTIAIDQGNSTSARSGMIYAVIPLSTEVQKVVDQGRVTLSFGGYFAGGNPSYCNFAIFAYSSSYEATEGTKYNQSVFKDSILNTETSSVSSTEGDSTVATGNAGYCSATIPQEGDWSASHASNFSYRTITANVLKGAKSIIVGLMAYKRSSTTLRQLDAFMGRPTVTLSCSGASIEVVSGGNGTVNDTALDNTDKNGNTYTFNTIQANATVEATPNAGYHFDKWEKTYDGTTSEWTGATSNYAKSTAKFYSYDILQGEKYTAKFAVNQITIVFHRNISSSDGNTRTQTYTYDGNVVSLGHWEKTDNKTFVGWAKEDSKDVVYHKYAKNSSGVYDCEASNSDISGRSLVNASDHGITIHLYAVWVDSDFGVLSGKTADSTWGSQSNPFVISGVQHLKNLSDIVNGVRLPVNSVTGEYYGENIVTVATSNNGIVTFENCYFVIATNIGSANSLVAFVPIGKDATYYFAGTIYGENNSTKTIYLDISQSGVSNVGLFGYTKGANISYIRTEGSIVGGTSTGGIVGCMENTQIFNCSNNATVTGTVQTGGIVGYGVGTTNCKIYGDISNSGNVSGTTFVGGIVGRWHGDWADANEKYGNFVNGGNVNGSGSSVGGVAGFADREIRNAINRGNVIGGQAVGGITGRNQAPIKFSFNEGTIHATVAAKVGSNEIAEDPTGMFVGGITGYSSANGRIYNCYNKGRIKACKADDTFTSNSNYAGGIAGYAQGEIAYCANIGGIIEGNDFLGGIVGSSSSTIDYCYDVEGQRVLRYQSGKIGAITGNGGNVTNSWAVKEKEYSAKLDSGSPTPTINSLGNKLVTNFEVTPLYISSSAETDKVWTDILTAFATDSSNSDKGISINGFKIAGNTTSGNFLALHNGNNVASLPYRIDGNSEFNEVGTTAKTAVAFAFVAYYGANKGSDVFAELKDINVDTSTKDYSAAPQSVGAPSNLPSVVGTDYFWAPFYFDSNGAGNATSTKSHAGTYKVYVDVWVVVDGEKCLVGRKETSWTIEKINLSVENAKFKYGQNIEQELVNAVKVTNSNGNVLSVSITVEFDTSAHNFYKSIANSANTFDISQNNVTIKDASGNIVTGNFVIGAFTVTVEEGDFGVQNSNVTKANIDDEKNRWGGVNNPYIIRTKAQLERLSSFVGGASADNSIYSQDKYVYVKATDKSFAGAYFKLAQDIASIGNITPIGSEGSAFSGNFDGNGKTLGGIAIDRNGSYIGLFGYISGATITNLTVSGSVRGSKYVGGLVGYALNSEISKITNDATVAVTTTASTNRLEYTFKNQDGNPGDSSKNEGWESINDGDTSTKYCATNSKQSLSFIMEYSSVVTAWGFSIFNGSDTGTYSKRKPNIIKIWGSNSTNTDAFPGSSVANKNGGNTPSGKGVSEYWTSIYEAENGIGVEARYYNVAFSSIVNYKYYWVYLSTNSLNADGSENSSGQQIQFAEFDILSTGEYAGGIVGYASGTNISEVNNNANIDGGNYTGGIAGYSTAADISNANNSGTISGGSYVGGIAGEFAGTNKSITHADNTASINGGNAGGGIVGKLTSGNVSSSHNIGSVSASFAIKIESFTGAYIGGIAGYSGGNITNCYNVAEVTTKSLWNSADYVGGITGYLTSGKKVSYCFNQGTVVGASYVGGIVGRRYGTVEYCYQNGHVKCIYNNSGANVGYITGNDSSVVANCWYLPNATLELPSEVTSVFKVNGHKLDVDESMYGPARIDGTVCTDYSTNGWANIENVKLNGFRVHRTVNPANSEYYYSSKGSNSTEYLKPTITENSSAQNAANRSDTSSFEVIAWYSATTASDIYCDVRTINISNKETTYNTSEQGFATSDVTEPTAGDVYTIVFDYLGKVTENRINSVVDADVYDTTVFVKIGDTIVGKKVKVTYTIKKKVLNISWAWTDSLYTSSINRTATAANFVFNTGEQGLTSLSADLVNTAYFTVAGDSLTKIDANTYARTYTLIDTKNYQLSTDASATAIAFKWTIRKNKLTVNNVWVRADAGKLNDFFTFEYNAKHQGILKDGITVTIENDTRGLTHIAATSAYSIGAYSDTIAAGEYSRVFTINDTTNYEVGKTTAYVGTSEVDGKGVSVNGANTVVTYAWKILPFDIKGNFDADPSKTRVWFGATLNLIVGNQLPQSVGGEKYYPLQNAQTGEQQVLVYGRYNYNFDNFVVYVKYNDGTIATLRRGTEYDLSELVVPTEANPNPQNTSVTARGLTNFDGNLTKYYTVLYSDFGWLDGKTPSTANWGGSEENPYVISTPEHLIRLSQIVNGDKAWNSIGDAALCYAPQTTATAKTRDFRGVFFKLAADIDLTKGYVSTDGVTNFLPIGYANTTSDTYNPFSGTFDGDGHEIVYVYNASGFKAGTRRDYVGLFGYVEGYVQNNQIAYATIKNLVLSDSNNTSADVYGFDYVGGVVGYAKNAIIGNVAMNHSKINGVNHVGGIVGYAENTEIYFNSTEYDLLTADVSGYSYVGAIAGEWIVTDLSQIGGNAGQATITISGINQQISGEKYVGGLVGWLDLSACQGSASYSPVLVKEGTKVRGTEYVGALFGVVIGNGYHAAAGASNNTAIVIDPAQVANVTLATNANAKVVGGLIGYIENAGLVFNTYWETKNTAFEFGANTSFVGGVIGILSKNASIEAARVPKDNDDELAGSYHKIKNNVTFASNSSTLGKFAGGIVGYVSSQAGTYWGEGTTILGNAISLYNAADISAKAYAGGIFGALGDVSLSNLSADDYAEISVSETNENRKDIIKKILLSGVREGSAGNTLRLDPTTASPPFIAEANGVLQNGASVIVSDSYAGGIAGFGGSNVRFVLLNKPQTDKIDVNKLNVYSGGNNVVISGSYSGGIAGSITENTTHVLQYVVVQAQFDNANATRVGGLVGYMIGGRVENCVVASTPSEQISVDTSNFKGSEYVGGLVGETQNAIIRQSVTSGFELASTSNTKGGLLGDGANPTIEASWTFYIANQAKYSTVSANAYGEYIIVDSQIAKINGESAYPIFEQLCAFAGISKGTAGELEFAVKVPGESNGLVNKQLAFYDASGYDRETSNKDSFSEFNNQNGILTIKLDMATGTSMQVCVVPIEFVNVKKWLGATESVKTKEENAENSYRRPSNSNRYHVDVTNAELYDDGSIKRIVANVYFECNGKLVVISDSGAYLDYRITGEYDSDKEDDFSIGSELNPYTISSQEEWNEFAHNVYTGKNNYYQKHVRLLKNITIDNSAHKGTANSTAVLDFGSTVSAPATSTSAPSNIGYNFAGDISKDSNENNFRGIFDGNGHYITINYTSGGYHRVSAFPNAAEATFRNLTIKGTIQAASKMDGKGNESTQDVVSKTASYDVAGFVGKPFGTLKFYNCTNEANITGLRNVAGIVGYNAGGQTILLEACVNTGNITSLQGTYTIAGFSDKYKYFDSLEAGYGTANIGFNSGTGGIIGAYTGDIAIESCRNAGVIIGGHNVGGIIGLHEGSDGSVATLTIDNCANTGNVLANSGYWGEDEGKIGGQASEGVRQFIFGYAGGLVGVTGQYSKLNMYASYNTGDVTTYSNIVGGLVGAVGVMYQPSGKNKVLTGGRSNIVYCYNTGTVRAGGTFPKRTQNYTSGREHFGGSVVGGIAGLVGDIQISQSYNAGDVWQFGIIAYGGSWQVRAGGIVGQSQPVSGAYILFDNLYNIGTIYVRSINTVVGWNEGIWNLQRDARYGAAISGYCDVSDDSDRIKAADCYSINNCVSSKIAKDISGDNEYLPFKNGTNEWYDERFDEWYKNDGVAGIGGAQVALIETGRVYNTYDALTAAMDSNSQLRMTGTNFAFGQSIDALTIDYSKVSNYSSLKEQILSKNSSNITSISESDVSNLSTIKWKAYPDSWLYVYGCLPQLSMFALDTQNGLSMRSLGYGKDQYDEYNKTGLEAGAEQYPYIIKDGIDLMGMQALVDAGYSFEYKYIEIANKSNNLDGLASEKIQLATYDSITTAAVDDQNNNMFKAVDSDGNYQVGKSYHLLLQGAIFNKARNKDTTYVGTDYSNWAWSTYYYNGGYRDNVWENGSQNPNKFYAYGGMRQLGIFDLQNFIPMGRGDSVFKGHFSGEQEGGNSTIINDVRITTGRYSVSDKEYGSEYGGLFAKVENAYIGYISIGGNSKIWSFSKQNGVSATGGIVGLASGNTVIENCGVSGSVEIGAYGVSKTNEYVENETIASDRRYAKDTYAGGIAGIVDTKQGNLYNAGIVATISNGNISTSKNIESAKSNIGGIVGYIEGSSDASGKGNSVRIENCEVVNATIKATDSATTSSHIGGVLGYGSEYVAAFITQCKVGVGGTVSVSGEHSLGGIAGGMSKAKGGYIDSCTVGEGTTIERIDAGNDGNIYESSSHGTAIGGLVGFTQELRENSPVTTTFSGESSFLGTIKVLKAATSVSQDSDAAISCIGGIAGDMGSGANFASGSKVTIGGTIDIEDDGNNPLAAANVGGVAGRTDTATFIGTFDVRPRMSTNLAENVGGFIGKNVGTVYILADSTDNVKDGLKGTSITIGGTIKGTSEIGGFVGVNNSGSTLNIGSNIANGVSYISGTLSITIEASVEGTNDNVGGIVGKNEGATNSSANDYATVDIVKGAILQNGKISGDNYVGGIIGFNEGLLTTGGGEAVESIGGIALSEKQINSIKNLSIANKNNVTGKGDYVGGVIGMLDSPSALRSTDENKGAIAGVFTNDGRVEGVNFVGGSIGFVGKNITITAKNDVDTEFKNTGAVNASGYYAGGSIGALVGTIAGVSANSKVDFDNSGLVNASGFVGGSIGVLAGPVKFAQFVNASTALTVNAVNAIGGSVGFIGLPTPLKKELNNLSVASDYIQITNTHFEAGGTLTVNADADAIEKASKDKDSTNWGGVGGAIGVIGAEVYKWGSGANGANDKNTYYARGNVVANGINNVGGIVGLILADNIEISNMLAYGTTVEGGENLGGIVGATTGKSTVINSAYAVEGTFRGSKTFGGIIGLAQADTDAKTSYWVKGYDNAILAGTNVVNLQNDLGQFEIIIERVGSQSIVFTEEFCTMYTPKTYYEDYQDKHYYGSSSTAITPVTDANVTWDDYFKDVLGIADAKVNNGAWVKPVENAVKYTTGAQNTGWYFVYSNDGNIGYINASHSSNANEIAWKRIADAYTASERESGLDKAELSSDIVMGKGSPVKSTLYATATAANVDSGYYLYMATSAKSADARPSATYSGGEFYIKTLTTNEDTLAENVAVYYRSISKGNSLTFNGYQRYAPVGITASANESVPYIANPSKDITKKDTYCYSADTSADSIKTIPNPAGSPYKSNVRIYYFDSNGEPQIVGGVEIDWEIKKRELTSEFSANENRIYGKDRDQDGDGGVKHDMLLVIGNIAPNAGINPGFVISITDEDANSYTFTWNGTRFEESTTQGGIEITQIPTGSPKVNGWSASDGLYNVVEPTDVVTKDFMTYIDFTNAKRYVISVTPTSESKELYVLSADSTFTVQQATLTLSGDDASFEDSVTFDNAKHDYSWKLTGLQYDDTIDVLAKFTPTVFALGKSAVLYNTDKSALKSGKVAIDGVDGVYFEAFSNGSVINVRNAREEGEYYVEFATLSAGNYKLVLAGGEGRKSKRLSISKNAFTISWSVAATTVNSHYYNKTGAGTIVATIKSAKPIEKDSETNIDFKAFVENFFAFSVKKSNAVNGSYQINIQNNQTATIVFTTGTNAGTYTASIAENSANSAFIERNKHNCALSELLPQSRTYKIKKRTLSIEFELTTADKTSYTYNATHQGLERIRISAATDLSGNSGAGLIPDDRVSVTLSMIRENVAYGNAVTLSGMTSSWESVRARISTQSWGTYVATVSFGGNTNYESASDDIQWKIDKYKLKLEGLVGGTKVYDGEATTPSLTVNNNKVEDGIVRLFGTNGDAVSIRYSATIGNDKFDSIVNVGKYSISIGGSGSNAISVVPATRDNVNTADNYDVSGSDTAEYEITPRYIKLTWEQIAQFIFSNEAQGLHVIGVEGVGANGLLAIKDNTSTLDGVKITGFAGKDTIEISIVGSITHVLEGTSAMSAEIIAVSGNNADGSKSIRNNYQISDGETSGEFVIKPSVVSIRFTATGKTLEKIYNGDAIVPASQIKDEYFTRTATGHNPDKNPFVITGTYEDKNAGTGKAVTFAYKFTDPSGAGDYELGTTDGGAYKVGTIYTAKIEVALDKLRSNKATRTYTDDVWYGGENGVSGNGSSKPYRMGEGFSVKGVLTSYGKLDDIKVVARYEEALAERNGGINGFDFAKYVNDVYRNADGTFEKAKTGSFYKKLVFTLTGDDASNYTFNVYTGGKKYSENDSTAGAVQTITVYDGRDTANGHSNANEAVKIQIEITVKSVRVEYANTAQSYANDDNSYNKNWLRVTGTNKDMDKAKAEIVVTNGWMYQDGKDRPADSTDEKREYHGYTTIRGAQNSQRLGASVSKENGMHLNYRLSNQPTLTIAYFVAEGTDYNVNSLARLLIASFYYTARQNKSDVEIIKIVSSGYMWVTLVSAADYENNAEFKLPADSPVKNSTATTWDEYFEELEEIGYSVFLNIEANDDAPANVWGYYKSTSTDNATIPTSFKQTKDISGKFTDTDIEILNSFFTVLDENGNPSTSTWSGNGTYLRNVLKAAVGKIATIDGSLFVSTLVDEGETALTGFDGTFDGNGYVIEYLNFTGFGKSNVGLFDIIGKRGVVKNLHLRNITINANSGFVGGIAGTVYAADAELSDENKAIRNVSFHGSATVYGNAVFGGLFGNTARTIAGAITLGSIVSKDATAAGVAGVTSAELSNVVSLMQITASGGTAGVFTTTANAAINDSYHMNNAVWNGSFINVAGKSVSYEDLMNNSVSGYGNANKYYYTGENEPTKGLYDVLSDVAFISDPQGANARQSMRLKDLVFVYLLMYSLENVTDSLTIGAQKYDVNVYSLSKSSWLVGNADGTSAKPVAIANKQNVSLLRELRFASFVLKANLTTSVSSPFAGAFYGNVDAGNYKITCNDDMFEAYANGSSWLAKA